MPASSIGAGFLLCRRKMRTRFFCDLIVRQGDVERFKSGHQMRGQVGMMLGAHCQDFDIRGLPVIDLPQKRARKAAGMVSHVRHPEAISSKVGRVAYSQRTRPTQRIGCGILPALAQRQIVDRETL